MDNLNDSNCYDLTMVPNKYLYNYLWKNYPLLKSKIIFNNLSTNTFNFISSKQSDAIEIVFTKT